MFNICDNKQIIHLCSLYIFYTCEILMQNICLTRFTHLENFSDYDNENSMFY